MSNPYELDHARYRLALDAWREDCQRRMALRYPLTDFRENKWALRMQHDGEIPDLNLTQPLADFSSKDISFVDALRCISAEHILEANNKQTRNKLKSFRLLHAVKVQSLFELDLTSLRSIEKRALETARKEPSYAAYALEHLQGLSHDLELLASKKVITHLHFHLSHETRRELLTIQNSHRKQWRMKKRTQLDHRIEALNEAFNALINDDPRLSTDDKVALSMLGLEMCAPSRVNEILCMSTDDYVTVDDYSQRRKDKETDEIHAVHQMLLITMKGSKGAQWSSKPALNFMIDFFHYCLNLVKIHGSRSRMLVEWYQQNPSTLYLTRELEYLRGQEISRRDLGKILFLDESRDRPAHRKNTPESKIFTALRHAVYKAPHPNGKSKNIDMLPWAEVESHLLSLVRDATTKCRAVAEPNYYKGDLAKMLFLFDDVKRTPSYFPQSAGYQLLSDRLKRSSVKKNKGFSPSLFEKLGITMPVDGKIAIAEIDTHDPRRWLTTMALRYGEKLSDVLIN